MEEKAIDEYYFRLIQLSDENPELCCEIKKHKNGLEKFIEKTKDCIMGPIHGKDSHICTFNNNGKLTIENGKETIYGHSKEFAETAREILQSPFANNVTFECNYEKSNTGPSKIMIDQNSIENMLSLYNNEIIDLCCFPTINMNKLNIISDGPKICDNLVEDILFTKYPKEAFPKYHRELIENSELAQKPIYVTSIPETLNKTRIQLELVEHEKEVVIQKIKK